MSPIKTCSCGKVYMEMPENAEFKHDLYWFNCECGSTCNVTHTKGIRSLFAQAQHKHNERVKAEYRLGAKPTKPTVKMQGRLALHMALGKERV